MTNKLLKHRTREHNNMIIVEKLNYTAQSHKPYYKTIAYWDMIEKAGNIQLNILSPDKNYKTFS